MSLSPNGLLKSAEEVGSVVYDKPSGVVAHNSATIAVFQYLNTSRA